MHFLPGTRYLVNFWILDDPGPSCGSNPDPNRGTFPEAVRFLTVTLQGKKPQEEHCQHRKAALYLRPGD
jgi:hypothetical protein